MNILIAEDDPIGAKILRLTLQQLGHTVSAAADGLEAWEMYDRQPFRVIVSDWMMPGLDGLDFCKRVRQRPDTAYTYFIMLTAAHTSADDFTLAMDAGVDDFLTKPFEREILRTRLHVADRILRYTTEIHALKEIVPICMYCKKVRNDDDFWERVETYFRNCTGKHFTHGVCPDCFDTQLKALDEMMVAPAKPTVP